MGVHPDYARFAAAYVAGRPQVLWTTLVADLDTPVSAMLKLAYDRPNSFLLESVEGGAIRGRYSFIGRDPDLIWRCRSDTAEIARPTSAGGDAFSSCPVAGESHCPKACRRCRPACSATLATTWCG